MKTRILSIVCIIIILICRLEIVKGQKSVNPFPLDEANKQEVLKKCETIIRYYVKKFGSSHLNQWSKEARDSFLIAKAKKINVLFVPDYYRNNAISPSIETTKAPSNDPIYPGALFYKITFYTDTIKEKLITNKLLNTTIWNTGEAKGFTVPIYNGGIFFRPPLWEDGEYQEWQRKNFRPYEYLTGYENMPTETLDQRLKRKQLEKRIKNKSN